MVNIVTVAMQCPLEIQEGNVSPPLFRATVVMTKKVADPPPPILFFDAL